AGMGGLNAAVHLRRLGIPFRVVERNAEVGGTWFENRYPGARVDTPSRMYSHIFGVDYPFPNPFCAQGDNEKYFNWVADHFDIRDQIDFETELRSLTWDERTQHWIAHLDGPSGSRELRANAVICGTGTFSRPSIPAFEGVDDFGGVATHTARWPADLDLAGKRVGVVGSGCTGYQTVPEIVKTAAHTYLFQRTPNWCFEIEGYLSPYPPEVLWLERNLPYYTNFSRFRAGWLYGSESIGKIWKIDPDFVDPHTRSPLNKAIREQRLEFMQGKLASRPDLLAAMTPDAPPLAARPVLIDRDYSIFDVLLRDDMTLVSDSIERITEAGIETTAETVDLDVIVFATGFRTDDYLWPMTITGRHGSTLESAWKRDGARAYLGTMLPDFPNLFLIYGPNSNPVGGMTVIDMEEMTTRFAVGSIAGLIERGHSSVEVTHEAFDRYNREIDRLEPTKLYADARSTSYFLNAEGRSVVNNPIDGRIMWKWLRDPVTPGVMPIGTADLRPFFEGDLVTRNGLEA
ncbi:NAD(P)/FAD-dependent oxidoreductase, partial [uncultured Nocardioides sp.]|uniref:flavin-containing monooxygenase n=1 Tax=uncultured Nocardioides sp. TaxID=198441 RepID=UPI002623B76B